MEKFKILLITSYFPSLDVSHNDPRTKYLHYYAMEWIRQGCDVLVLHSVPAYPRLFSQAVFLLERRIGFNGLQLGRYWQNSEAIKESKYQSEGMTVIRTPIVKLFPHQEYSVGSLNRHRRNVLQSLSVSGYMADVVISDFITPSVYIANDINRKFGIPFFQILHQVDLNYFKNGRNGLREMMGRASGILYRSFSLANLFKLEGLESTYEDYIFSGIPNDTVFGEKRHAIKKLVFIGSLRMSKNIHIILEALAAATNRDHYVLEIIGDGPYEKELKALTKKLGLETQTVFCGRLSRETVFKKLNDSDCLIMVSKETFGMVYIEAISQGCIVIASRGQGMDGIIVHGENGFLVEIDKPLAIADILDKLALMSRVDIERISGNALQTAKKMTDGRLAEDLLARLKTRIKHLE